MSYIVMARDECNEEFRPSDRKHATYEAAEATITELREEYPECRSMWVEELHDKAYYQNIRQEYEDRYGDDADYYYDMACEMEDRQNGY